MSAYTILVQNNTFKGYVKLYQKGQQGTDGDEKVEVVYQKVNPRWEVCVLRSDNYGFKQASFVNCIATSKVSVPLLCSA